MSTSPTKFNDLPSYPTVFLPEKENSIATYGLAGFPVSFVFNPVPRAAQFRNMAATQSGRYLLSSDPFGPNAIQIAMGEQKTIELSADRQNIKLAQFSLRVLQETGTVRSYGRSEVAELREPQYAVDISHLFSMGSSTWSFSALRVEGIDYYATASLDLKFHSWLEDTSHVWVPVSLPDKTSTSVLIAPSNCYGIMDVEATVRLRWYMNPARTVPAPLVPYRRPAWSFGMRFYVTKPGIFLNKTSLNENSGCVLSAAYTTSVAEEMGGEGHVDVAYWGGGARSSDIFFGKASSIEIADSGLPVQAGHQVAAYVLPNPLIDSYTSSSSSSSITMTESTSSQTRSTSSSSWSSSSSSTSSTSTSSSSSSFSRSSSSSSTRWMPSSSLSSLSSSSSAFVSSLSSISGNSSSSTIATKLILYYPFVAPADEFGKVDDFSAEGNDATIGADAPGLGAPTWGSSYGMAGGGFRFFGDGNNSDYMARVNPAGMDGSRKGTIGINLKASANGGLISAVVCLANVNTSPANKTALVVGYDRRSGYMQYYSKMTIGGIAKWEIRSSVGSLLTGRWQNVAVVHDGVSPVLYVDGVLDTASTPVYVDPSAWMLDMYASSLPPDRIVVGGEPDYFQPFIVRGFTGDLDDVKIWNAALVAADVAAEHAAGMSSSSTSSKSSSSTP